MVASATDAEVLERQSEPGWLLPYLIGTDLVTFRDPLTGEPPVDARQGNYRWAYWLWILEHLELPVDPIPRLHFQAQPSPADAKIVQDWLHYRVSRYGKWYDDAWLELVHWLLFGFGRQGLSDALARIPDDVKAQWYRQVNLHVLLRNPCDWSAFVLQGGLQRDKRTGSPWAKSTGFFSTPMQVCNMMAEMNFSERQGPLADSRLDTVLDPCVGTGSMLLAASNYSLRLFGTDVVYDLCLCSELNGWLWMPWLVVMPEEVGSMLQERYDTLTRLRVMRDLMVGGRDVEPTREGPVPTGIALSDDPVTVAKAAERKEQAEAFYAAARSGELEQLDLFGGAR